MHYETYRNVYAALVAKRLIKDHNQTFRITDSGLRAIGVTPIVTPVAPAPQPAPQAARQPPQAAPKASASTMSRLFGGLLGRRA